MRHYALVDTIFCCIFSEVELKHLHICLREAGLWSYYSVVPLGYQ